MAVENAKNGDSKILKQFSRERLKANCFSNEPTNSAKKTEQKLYKIITLHTVLSQFQNT